MMSWSSTERIAKAFQSALDIFLTLEILAEAALDFQSVRLSAKGPLASVDYLRPGP